MDNSPSFLFWSPEHDNAQTYSQSSDFPNAEEEQHRDPDPRHGRSAAINTLLPIQNNPPLSHMGDGFIGTVLEFERPSLPLGLSPNRRDLLNGDPLTHGISPPSPPRPSYDVHEFLSIMKSLDAVLELPFPASGQYTSSCPPQSPFLHQSSQFGLPPLPWAPLRNPRANPIPKRGAITGPASEPLPLPGLDAFPCGLITEEAHQEAKGARNSEEMQIDEWPMYPATSCQALMCDEGFAEFSMSGQGASPLHSTHRNEEAPSPNLQSEVQERHHVTVTSSIASSQVASADKIRRTFWCPDREVDFVQRQGLNRHELDKHSPRNICHLCGTFEWSPAREYLFTRHLERHHPGVKLANDSRRLGDKRRATPRRHRPYPLIPSTIAHT